MFDTLTMLENGLVSYGEAMRIVASDVQNFGTDGYKQSRYTFVSLFTQSLAKFGSGSSYVRGSGNVHEMSSGVVLLPLGLNFQQGGLKRGAPLNAAINGDGLFVMKPDNLNDYVYTRASDWVLSADGTLVDSFGRRVMGYKYKADGTLDKSTLVPIVVDLEKYDATDIGFEENGIMSSNYIARQSARDAKDGLILPPGDKLYQLAVANISNPAGMEATQGNAYRINLSSGEVRSFSVSGDTGVGEVTGGFSEASNVDPAETTIIGIQLQRGVNAVQGAFTMITKFLTTFIQAIEKA